MHTNASFDYAVLRVVPRVEREEFINAGVILYCRERRYLSCRIALDTARLAALHPEADHDVIREHLNAIASICRGHPDGGPVAALPQHERFHWLTAPRSTVLQTSPIRSGICPREGSEYDLDGRLDEIAASALPPPRAGKDRSSEPAVGEDQS